MQGSGCKGSDRRAPLALLESFESRAEETSEMKEFWSSETKHSREFPNHTWTGQDFAEMARKQQNYKMYKAQKIILY